MLRLHAKIQHPSYFNEEGGKKCRVILQNVSEARGHFCRYQHTVQHTQIFDRNCRTQLHLGIMFVTRKKMCGEKNQTTSLLHYNNVTLLMPLVLGDHSHFLHGNQKGALSKTSSSLIASRTLFWQNRCSYTPQQYCMLCSESLHQFSCILLNCEKNLALKCH